MDINKLIYLANYLDKIGLTKEAELIDRLIAENHDNDELERLDDDDSQ